MKRATTLLLTAIYMLSCLGIAANSFYCCGKLQSTTLQLSGYQLKKVCNMARQMPGCCKTKKQLFKIKDQHVGASIVKLVAKTPVSLQSPFLPPHVIKYYALRGLYSFNSHAPPYSQRTPIYKLTCNYRI